MSKKIDNKEKTEVVETVEPVEVKEKEAESVDTKENEVAEEAAEVKVECAECAVEEKTECDTPAVDCAKEDKEDEYKNDFIRFIDERENEEKSVSIGDWLIVRAVRCLPFIQLIPYLIWAFGHYPKSKKNWARAELIWIALRIIIIVAIVLIIKAIFS